MMRRLVFVRTGSIAEFLILVFRMSCRSILKDRGVCRKQYSSWPELMLGRVSS